MFTGFSPETIDFLWGIRLNNNREWFEAHKKQYQTTLYEPMKAAGCPRSPKQRPSVFCAQGQKVDIALRIVVLRKADGFSLGKFIVHSLFLPQR